MKEELLISVILPVYNAEKFIASSIQSILQQTYKNFELIIINDGSTDASNEIITSFKDERIKYYRQENMGMAKTLNKGIAFAKGTLIARQDADDFSYPDRLERQVDFLKKNPSIVLLGTHARIINDSGIATGRFHKHPLSSKALQFFLLFDNPFVHSSVMIQKSCLLDLGCYDINKPSLTQDYDLWSRIARKYPVANIDSVLLDYREVESGISQTESSNSSYAGKVVSQSIENIVHCGIPENRAVVLAKAYHQSKESNAINGNKN